MTGINHKQAQRYLRAAADGLLRENQRALLNTHLRECASCRAEADELNALEARLQKNFQNRWDANDGPSKNVMTTIQSRSRRINMTNRINTGFKMLGGLALILAIALLFNLLIGKVQNPPAINPTIEPVMPQSAPSIGTDKSNGEWIAFIGGKTVPWPDSTALDITQNVYLIHPDGTGFMNLTNNEDHTGYLFENLQWSPDGKNLIFLRIQNDKRDFIRTNPDIGGYSTITRPITDPDNYGYSWSPNSAQIAFADSSSGNYDIYTEYADGRNDPQLRQLTNDPAQDVGFVWSPDGSQIAFERLSSEKLSIYVMNNDGSNQREIARGSGKVKLLWSQDGKSIYASSTENSWLECEACVATPAIYRIDINKLFTRQIYAEKNISNVQAWHLYEKPQNTLYFMRMNPPVFLEFWGTWMQIDGNSVRSLGEMNPHQTCRTTAGNSLSEYISPNERFSIISDFCAGGFDLYLADREAITPEKQITHLLRLPLSTRFSGEGGDGAYLPISWSPDGRTIMYKGNSGYGPVIYLLDVEKLMEDPATKLIPLTGTPSEFSNSFDIIQWFGEIQWQPKP